MNKADLHRIVDRLPDHLVEAAGEILEVLEQSANPLLPALQSAQPEAAGLPEQDLQAIREGWSAWKQSQASTLEELKHTLAHWLRR